MKLSRRQERLAASHKEQQTLLKIEKRVKIHKLKKKIPEHEPHGAHVEAVARLRAKYKRGWSKLKWKPRLVTEGVRHHARKILAEASDPANEKTDRRVRDFIETFLIINHHRSLEEGCENLFAQMLKDGLGAKTTKDYLKKAADEFGGTGPRFERVIKTLGLLAADEDPNHAPDRTVTQCRQLLVRMRRACPRAAAVCELIMICGLRCKDITRLRTKRVVWQLSKKMMKMRVRVTKNIRDQSESVVTRIPLWFGRPTASLMKLMNEKEKPFEHDDVRQVLRGIRQVDPEVTTYTFRRVFMHKALKECNFDFDLCVKKYTLHKQVKTLRAYYDSLDL